MVFILLYYDGTLVHYTFRVFGILDNCLRKYIQYAYFIRINGENAHQYKIDSESMQK